jgi:hypothetical protein
VRLSPDSVVTTGRAGVPLDDRAVSPATVLEYGETILTVAVTASDTYTVTTYTIVVTRR